LIIYKAIAGRPQDLADSAGVIARQGKRLQVAYIRQWLRDFDEVLADTEVLERFERAYRGRSSK
jgi:hypothetical protein